MTEFGKAAAQLAQQAQDLDRRFAEKQALLDTITDAVQARRAELKKLDDHLTELRAAVRGIYGKAK
jgi:uncharacterized coiled-coil protein SlyX